MESKATSLKPFHLEDKKSGPKASIEDATFRKWQQTIEANLRRNDKWTRILNQTWDHDQENLGLVARAEPAASAAELEGHVKACSPTLPPMPPTVSTVTSPKGARP